VGYHETFLISGKHLQDNATKLSYLEKAKTKEKVSQTNELENQGPKEPEHTNCTEFKFWRVGSIQKNASINFGFSITIE
jgi:hypothetical protein